MSRLNFDRNVAMASGMPLSGATQTLAFNNSTAVGVELDWPGVYRLEFTAAAWFCCGVSGSCDASSTNAAHMPANGIEYFGLPLSGSQWLSVLGESASGNCYITRMSASVGSNQWIY